MKAEGPSISLGSFLSHQLLLGQDSDRLTDGRLAHLEVLREHGDRYPFLFIMIKQYEQKMVVLFSLFMVKMELTQHSKCNPNY